MPKLNRTGDRPIQFKGSQIATATSEAPSGGSNRWHELYLYEINTGRFAVAVCFRTQWQDELDHDAAAVVDTMDEAVEFLRAYDPLGHLKPFPSGGQFEAKQELRNTDIRQRYEAAVSDLLADFAEEV
jgi:hypothetical protein